MMKHDFVKNRPDQPSFSRVGADGYQFPIKKKNLEIDYINSKTGHCGKVVSDIHTHYYYIIEGSGEFIIDNKIYAVQSGQMVEVPPKHSLDYKGKMKMILIMEPPFDLNHIAEVD